MLNLTSALTHWPLIWSWFPEDKKFVFKKLQIPPALHNSQRFGLIVTYIIFLFARNWVAADFSVLNSSKVPRKERTFQHTFHCQCEMLLFPFPTQLVLYNVQLPALAGFSTHKRELPDLIITLCTWIYWVREMFLRKSSTYIFSISCFSSKALGRSLLFPSTRTWNPEKEMVVALLKKNPNRHKPQPKPENQQTSRESPEQSASAYWTKWNDIFTVKPDQDLITGKNGVQINCSVQRASMRTHQLINLRTFAAHSAEIPQTYSTFLYYTLVNLQSRAQTHTVESSKLLFQLHLLCFVSTEGNNTTEGQQFDFRHWGQVLSMLILTSQAGPNKFRVQGRLQSCSSDAPFLRAI